MAHIIGLQYPITETKVIFEPNPDGYIIFSRVSEDNWGHHGYSYGMAMYHPITMEDGTIITHPYVYLNAGARALYERRGFGIVSFNAACEIVAEKIESIKLLMDMGVEVAPVDTITMEDNDHIEKNDFDPEFYAWS